MHQSPQLLVTASTALIWSQSRELNQVQHCRRSTTSKSRPRLTSRQVPPYYCNLPIPCLTTWVAEILLPLLRTSRSASIHWSRASLSEGRARESKLGRFFQQRTSATSKITCGDQFPPSLKRATLQCAVLHHLRRSASPPSLLTKLYIYNGKEFSDDCPVKGSPSPDTNQVGPFSPSP
jgi:hypothetical protein